MLHDPNTHISAIISDARDRYSVGNSSIDMVALPVITPWGNHDDDNDDDHYQHHHQHHHHHRYHFRRQDQFDRPGHIACDYSPGKIIIIITITIVVIIMIVVVIWNSSIDLVRLPREKAS